MKKVSTKCVVQVVEKIACIAFLGLGCFFIYQGEVWQRFNLRRTNFALYDEEITELPTIYTVINNPNLETSIPVKFGNDFKISLYEYHAISYRDLDSRTASLNKGNNNIGNSPLVVNLQQEGNKNNFQIIPVNYVSGMHKEYVLTYIFKNSSLYNLVNFGIALKSQNNSYVHCLLNYFDGKVHHHRARMGEKNFLVIEPERFSFNKNIRNCREKPYHEVLFDKISDEIVQKCTEPCRPKCVRGFATGAKKIIDRFPACQTSKQSKCFYEVLKNVKNRIEAKPCTKLQYKVVGSTWPTNKNQATFIMRFAIPSRVSVNEEYLVYDLVAVVSAIGGTLGLCIGFSFRDATRMCLEWTEKGLTLIYTGITGVVKCRKISKKNHDTSELNIA